MTTTIRTDPARLVAGDIVYRHGQVMEDPQDLGYNTTSVEFEGGRSLFPTDYRHLYRVEIEGAR